MNRKEEIGDWDAYFMSLVYAAATRSKDESTNIGAIIVNPSNCVVATGYNSFPRGIKDDIPERQQRPGKYYYFAHAERNAIYSAALQGISLKGCRMYTNGLPCSDCGIAIIQSGVVEVITHKDWEGLQFAQTEQWKESCQATYEMFAEANVTYRQWNGQLTVIPIVPIRLRGKQILFSSTGVLLGAPAQATRDVFKADGSLSHTKNTSVGFNLV